MKTYVSILALCLIYSSLSEALTVFNRKPEAPQIISSNGNSNKNHILSGQYSVPLSTRVSPECASVLQQVAQWQLKSLDQQRAWLEQELALNQQDRAVLIQISQGPQQGRSIIQSDEEPEKLGNINSNILVKATEAPNSANGIIPSIISGTGNVAGDILNTAGQLAKDDIDFKAALIGGALGGAGRAASSALHKTGQVAAHAVSNIEDGFKNIFGNFGK